MEIDQITIDANKMSIKRNKNKNSSKMYQSKSDTKWKSMNKYKLHIIESEWIVVLSRFPSSAGIETAESSFSC